MCPEDPIDGSLQGLFNPPYYVVVFTSLRTTEEDGYQLTSAAMEALAAAQPGYLGMETARDRLGITLSYWRDLEAIAAWRRAAEHLAAQRAGRSRWYSAFAVRIARVEREYAFP
jgi:heme-degrading monooxygenase HmoA